MAAERLVSGQILSEVEQDLMRASRTLEVTWPDGPLDDHVDTLSAALAVRLTVIDPDGRVLADSTLDGENLTAVENHLQRQEIQDAFRQGFGRDERTSSTTGVPSLYIARILVVPTGLVVVRASTPLAQLDQARWRVRGSVGLALALALGLATLSAGLFGRWAQQTLERLLGQARQLSGSSQDPPPLSSISRLSASLEKALHDLAAERDVQAALVAAVADGVITIDKDGRIERANEPAAHLTGCPVATMQGALLAETWPAPGVLSLVQATLADRAIRSLEVEQAGPPRRRLEVQVVPLHAENAALVLHDRTQERAVERMRRDFVANVSHELKTPVAVIAAHAESLLDGGLEDPTFARHSVEATQRQSARLAGIVTDLLSLSRLESGAVTLHPQRLAVREVAEKAAAQATVRFPERCVSIDVAPDLDVWADPTAVDHAVSNLAENALQHTPPGATITIRARAHGNRVYVEVVDDGPGIPAEHRDRIFERFYRVDPGRSRDRGGTGLGLAIVRHLAQVSGGTASYVPNEPAGSIFRLDLPMPATQESAANA
jgi:two-component system phosphate regulon sensor histidine kinase PhoR